MKVPVSEPVWDGVGLDVNDAVRVELSENVGDNDPVSDSVSDSV